MTTEQKTMMAPTDRSMPAVRMIRVWAMPTMPMIVTCCRISERLKGAKNRSPTRAEEAGRRTSTSGGTARRVAWRKCWSALRVRALVALEVGDGRRLPLQAGFSSPRRSPAGASRCGHRAHGRRSCASARRAGWPGPPLPVRPVVPLARLSPSSSRGPSSVSFESTPGTGLSVMSMTPVSVKSRPGSSPASCRYLANSTIASSAHRGHLAAETAWRSRR